MSMPHAPNQGAYKIEMQIDELFREDVPAQEIIAAVEATLAGQQVAAGEITVVIAGDEMVQELNARYRGVDAPTDVLSFAAKDEMLDAPEALLPDEVAGALDDYYGDIIIALPYARRQAAHYGNDLTSELRLLAVHGTLHLLGFDHSTPVEEAQMWEVQETILAQFGDDHLAHRVYDAPDDDPNDANSLEQ